MSARIYILKFNIQTIPSKINSHVLK